MITSIVGKIGSGKSHKQLSYALQQVNDKRKRLVTNFGLNFAELRRYAALTKQGWIAHLIDTNQIAIIDSAESIEDLLIYRNSVVCLDEAGIFLNARQFAQTPKRLLMDLAQSRKFGCDLIYAAQFDEQVDKQVRMLTQYYIHCDSITAYDKALRRPKLLFKKYSYFDADTYLLWAGSAKARSSLIRTWLAAFKTEFQAVTRADKQLFKCFDSFSRLEEQSQSVRTIRDSYIEPDLSKVYHDTLSAQAYRSIRRYFGGAVLIPDSDPRYLKSRLPVERDEPDEPPSRLPVAVKIFV